MPRVAVLAEVPGCDPEAMLAERVPAEMLSDGYYADQLVERIGWALLDAEQHERRFTSDGNATRFATARPDL